VLKDGLLQQCDIPRALYEHPANAFVAGFIGSPAMNLVTVPVTAGGAKLDGLTLPLPHRPDTGEVTVGIRPESLHLVGEDTQAMSMTVELVEELGADAYVYGDVPIGGEHHRFIVRVDGRQPPPLASTVRVAVKHTNELHLFHPETGLRVE
jgi:multiple sugar transport system ATP-binding protein